MIKIVVINGSGGVGKDQFIKYFAELTNDNTQVINHSTIDTVREALKFFGVHPDKKGDKERKFLQAIKQAWIDYNDGPLKECICYIDLIRTTRYQSHHIAYDHNVFFVHCREPEEIQKLKDKYDDCITVLIKRPGRPIPENDSDKNVDNFSYNYEYRASSLIELKRCAQDFIYRVGLGEKK